MDQNWWELSYYLIFKSFFWKGRFLKVIQLKPSPSKNYETGCQEVPEKSVRQLETKSRFVNIFIFVVFVSFPLGKQKSLGFVLFILRKRDSLFIFLLCLFLTHFYWENRKKCRFSNIFLEKRKIILKHNFCQWKVNSICL